MQFHRLVTVFALALTMSAGLSGCITSGQKFTMAQVSELKPGVSTREEAVALLGPPMSATAMPEGAVLLQWMYNHASFAAGTGRHVAIAFDADGKMLRVTHRFEINH